MRLLLTGASGFLGSNFLGHVLDNTNWDVVCPASFSHRGVPERITQTIWKDLVTDRWHDLQVHTCDLATPIADTTAALFDKPDIIVNFASESHIPRSLANPVPFVQNNVNVMLHLLEYARTLPNLRAFVHISTDEVYGPAAQGGHAEWSPVLPSTPYSASKAAQEALGISYWRSFGVPLILVNTMNPIGPMQDPEKFIPMTIGRVLRRELVSIHAGADGQVGSRVYVHALDLAAAIMHVIGLGAARYPDDERPDRWNVVGERDVDNLELALLIAAAVGQQLHHEVVVSDRPGHGLRYALDGSKLEAAGWKPAAHHRGFGGGTGGVVEGEPAVDEPGAAVRVNLGSSNIYAVGWHNVDHDPCPGRRDETVDLTGPLPWAEGTITAAYAGHLLEHLTFEQCHKLLVDLRDKMAPGAELMVVGPDIELAQRLGTGRWHTMNDLLHGGNRWPGDQHQWECTTALVVQLLRDAGWSEITDVGITNVPGHWPVVDREPLWQCAVSARP